MTIHRELGEDIVEFGKTLGWYARRKGELVAIHVEGGKGVVVEVLKARRGTYQKPFLHVGMVLLTITSILVAPLLIPTYPGRLLAAPSSVSGQTPSSVLNDQADITNIDTVTTESSKPRRDVIEYTVEGGDTLSSIAKKFSNDQLGITIDAESIAYLNDFSTDKILKPGDTVKIPPVSGVIVTVRSGDTIYTLAKKYGLLSAQPIVDWQYNSFADDEKFSLTTGQTLVIPGGHAPEAPPAPPPVKVDNTPFTGGSGQFGWPTSGTITQGFSWYHTGVDIANNIGTRIYAADSGRVIQSTMGGYYGGYGNHILIDHGNGYVTMYAHLTQTLVSADQDVSRGQLIGLMGSTGRSTGPHLHFEVRKNGQFQSPLSFLK